MPPITLHNIMSVLPRTLRRHRLAMALVKFRLVDPICLCRSNRVALAFIDVRDPNPRNVLLLREYDREFFHLARLFIHDGAYFDVGANFGLNTFGLLPLVSEKVASFHLFEANPKLCECLRRSAALFPKRDIVIVNKAIGNVTGTLTLEINNEELGQSYISCTGIQVPARRIDDYIDVAGIKVVDLMKMDIEGYEPEALLGAESNMKSGRIKAVIFEVKDVLLRRQGFSVSNLLAYVSNCGYRLFLWRADSIVNVSVKRLKTLMIRNVRFPVMEITSAPDGIATDILAIHESMSDVIV